MSTKNETERFLFCREGGPAYCRLRSMDEQRRPNPFDDPLHSVGGR